MNMYLHRMRSSLEGLGREYLLFIYVVYITSSYTAQI